MLDREVERPMERLPAGRYGIPPRRLDKHPSNLNRHWADLARDRDWPDQAGWDALRRTDQLEFLEPISTVEAEGGSVTLSFALPMPAVSLIELFPVP